MTFGEWLVNSKPVNNDILVSLQRVTKVNVCVIIGKVEAVKGLGQRRLSWDISDLDLVPLLRQ